MFIILPDSVDPGIHSMEANLTTATIKALMTTLQVTLDITIQSWIKFYDF